MNKDKEYTKEELLAILEEIKGRSREEVLSRKIEPQELEGAEIIEYPRIIEKPFVKKKRTFWQKVTFRNRGNYTFNPEIKQPILQLIRDDGYTDWIEGVKAGLFKVKKKGSEDERGIFLSPKKLTTLNIEPYPKMWIAYEREMSPYPIDIYHEADEIIAIIRKMEANRNLLKDEAALLNARMWFWLAIIAAVGVLVYIGFRNGWFDELLGNIQLLRGVITYGI